MSRLSPKEYRTRALWHLGLAAGWASVGLIWVWRLIDHGARPGEWGATVALAASFLNAGWKLRSTAEVWGLYRFVSLNRVAIQVQEAPNTRVEH